MLTVEAARDAANRRSELVGLAVVEVVVRRVLTAQLYPPPFILGNIDIYVVLWTTHG
jgi:hypothetical protein